MGRVTENFAVAFVLCVLDVISEISEIGRFL